MSQGPTIVWYQKPTGPGIPLGTILKAEGEAGGDFIKRSWASGDFVIDELGQTPHAGVTTPSSAIPPLRKTVMVDPCGAWTFATLVPLSPTALRPPAHSLSFKTSLSRLM